MAARSAIGTAFDISASAIEMCRHRYPESVVNYQVADLFNLPSEWLQGFDLVYGARPLKRVVQREILNPLASKILSGDVKEGSRVRVDAEGRKLVFRPDVHSAAA